MTFLARAAIRAYGTVLPRHAADWFERTLLTPRRVRGKRFPKPEATGHFYREPHGAGWLAVTSWGRGPAVLLVHGWGGNSASMGGFVDPLVRTGHRVIAFDLPAHGHSDGRRTNLIECTGALLQIGRSCGPLRGIVTHSFGGAVAANALRHRLESERAAMLAPPRSIKALSLAAGDAIGLPRRTAELMFQRLADRLRLDWRQFDTDRMVSRLRAPLLVVHDEDDRQVPVSHGAAVAQAAPAGRLLTTAGLGHRDVLTDPTVITAVLEFLTRRAGRERRIA